MGFASNAFVDFKSDVNELLALAVYRHEQITQPSAKLALVVPQAFETIDGRGAPRFNAPLTGTAHYPQHTPGEIWRLRCCIVGL
jgi:hypothetical protein